MYTYKVPVICGSCVQSRRTEKDSRLSKFMMIFGFFSTMPILSLFSYTLYVWGLMLFFGYLLLHLCCAKRIIISKHIEISYLCVVAVSLCSSVVSVLRMPPLWKEGWATTLIQYLIVFCFYLFFISGRHNKELMAFIVGIYYAAVFQMIWGYMQFILFELGIDLNNLVFRDMLHLIDFSATHTYNSQLKISAFCWNAANLAPLVIFGFAFSNNAVIKCLFLILAVISGSRTLLIGIAFYIFIAMLLYLKRIRFFSARKCLILSALLFVCIIGVLGNSDVMSLLSDKVTSLVNAVLNPDSEGSANTHLKYILTIFEVTGKNDFLSNLIGYGMGCSGYVFSHFYGQSLDQKWSVECDYINYLWSFGYIGFAFYYFWYVKNIIKAYKIDLRYALLFFTLLFEGIFYNITFNWVTLLILSIFILCKYKINIFSETKNAF